MFSVRRKQITGSFLARVRAGIQEAAGVGTIAGRISVPSNLAWWYFQEFGTATRGDAGRASGRPFDIYPVNARALAWEDTNGGSVVRAYVKNHPGIYPQHFVTSSLQSILNIAASNVQQALRRSPFSVLAIRTSLLEQTMPSAKEVIVEAMSERLPGVRIKGKLGGQVASDVFNRDSFIRNVGA